MKSLKNREFFRFSGILAAFSSLFIIFVGLQEKGFLEPFSLAGWDFNQFSTAKYIAVFSLYLVLLLALFFFPRKEERKAILIGASFLFATLICGKLSFLLYLGAALFYLAIHAKLAVSFRASLIFILYILFIFLALEALFPAKSAFFWYAYIFAGIFSIRFILYLYHSFVYQKKERFGDYILYIFCPAYFIILPHIIVLPKFDYFKNSFCTQDNFINLLRSGLRKIALGLSELFILAALLRIYFTHPLLKSIPAIEIPAHFVSYLLAITGYGNILLGLVRGLGFDIRSPFRKPFLSADILDFFDRTLSYFKDYLISVFFVPASIVLRRLDSRLASFVSVLVAVTLGVTSYSFLTFGLEFCTMLNNSIRGPASVFAGFALQALYPVGIRGFSYWIFEIGKKSFILGILLGLQLIYNQKVSAEGERPTLFSRFSGNVCVKLFQVLAMLVIFYYIR